MAKRPAKRSGKKGRLKKKKVAPPKVARLKKITPETIAVTTPTTIPTSVASSQPAVITSVVPEIPVPEIPAPETTAVETIAPKSLAQPDALVTPEIINVPERPKTRRASVLRSYIQLMRLDRPIGILLLLWPTYWSLWLAAKGIPSLQNLVIFTLGCVLMRSAGCVINDYADRNIDGKVKRTRQRPLASGLVSTTEALLLFAALCVFSLMLVLMTNPLTIQLSIGGLLLAIIYPFTKRVTHMPQVVLGAAFAWSIPMAFAAETGELNRSIWLLYLAVVLWAVIYDTFYAMVDRDDDIKIGVKSTAILFGEADRGITAFLQGLFLLTLVLAGRKFELGTIYNSALFLTGILFAYQQWLIKDRLPDRCFKAFLNNNYVGLVIFIGIAADYYF